jgi:Holliday junction resolvase RusA-like endonuclease
MSWQPFIEFFIAGKPRPGGSKTVMPLMRGRTYLRDAISGRPLFNVVDDCDNKDWKRNVAHFGFAAMRSCDLQPQSGPLRVEVVFHLHRPKNHYGSGANAERLKPGAPPFPAVKPDVLKFMRPTEDSLTGVVWEDDARIVWQVLRKVYTEEEEGAAVSVFTWQPEIVPTLYSQTEPASLAMKGAE